MKGKGEITICKNRKFPSRLVGNANCSQSANLISYKLPLNKVASGVAIRRKDFRKNSRPATSNFLGSGGSILIAEQLESWVLPSVIGRCMEIAIGGKNDEAAADAWAERWGWPDVLVR